MHRNVFAAIAMAALSLVTGEALAADLPVRPVSRPPPIMSPVPIYNWTGFYVGANLGGAWGSVDATNVNTGATVSPHNSGFAGGGQLGYDFQMGNWVIGVRNLIDGTSISNGATLSDSIFSGTVNSSLHWFDTLTARGGYLIQPNLLLYVQGGAAWTSWSVTANNSFGVQVAEISGGNRTGWTIGGGAEWMFVPHWSAFLEYNFMGFGSRSGAGQICGVRVCTADTFTAKSDLQNLLVGVNYRF